MQLNIDEKMSNDDWTFYKIGWTSFIENQKNSFELKNLKNVRLERKSEKSPLVVQAAFNYSQPYTMEFWNYVEKIVQILKDEISKTFPDISLKPPFYDN